METTDTNYEGTGTLWADLQDGLSKVWHRLQGFRV